MGLILIMALGYLLGSIPTGKIVGRYRGIDIQKHGSRNIGFANAVRVLGWKPAFIVLFGDAVKGFIPTFTALRLDMAVLGVCLVGLSTLAGNILPVWLGFRGGKGVATGLGISLAISPLIAVMGVGMYLLVISIVRISGPASTVSALCMPLFSIWIIPEYAVYYLVLATVVVWTHRHYIRQMIRKPVRYDD